MQGSCGNIYQNARLRAGLTQERAAEALELSVRSIADYETDVRVPPGFVVRAMAAVYGAPGLRLEHARDTDQLGIVPAKVRPRPLAQTVLRIHNGMRALRAWVPRLAEIAEDDTVDESEAVDLEAIQRYVGEVVAACLEFEFCDTGIKKDRPDVGSSKRSRSQAEPENHHERIISGFSPDCKRQFIAGEAVHAK